jgi:hypothetical protein
MSSAGAHETDPHVVSVLESVAPKLPSGVTVQLRASAAEQLVIANSTPTPLDVLAPTGEVFLRIARDGVLANVASPAWHLSNSPTGTAPIPSTAKPGATPRVVRVSREGSWGWFDHRLHPSGSVITPPPATTVLGHWTIPFRFGNRIYRVRGRTEYRPFLGRFEAGLDAASVPGAMSADILQGRVPGISLQVRRGRVVVYGADSEVFATVTPTSASVNRASRTWREDRRMQGLRVDAPLPGGGRLTWLDGRLRYPSDTPPPDVVSRASPSVVGRWRIKVSVDGAPAELTGPITWQPERAGTVERFSPVRPPATAYGLILGVAAVAGGASWWLLVRRRRS